MNVPYEQGIDLQQNDTENKADEKKLSLLIALQEERKSASVQDHRPGMRLAGKRTYLPEAGEAHVHLIGIPGRCKPPDKNMMKTAQVEEALRRIPLHADLHVPSQISDERTDQSSFLPSINSRVCTAPVTFISSFV